MESSCNSVSFITLIPPPDKSSPGAQPAEDVPKNMAPPDIIAAKVAIDGNEENVSSPGATRTHEIGAHITEIGGEKLTAADVLDHMADGTRFRRKMADCRRCSAGTNILCRQHAKHKCQPKNSFCTLRESCPRPSAYQASAVPLDCKPGPRLIYKPTRGSVTPTFWCFSAAAS